MSDKESAMTAITKLHNIQKNESSSRIDNYMRGMYNGMEVIRASLAGEEPDFIDKDGVFMSEVER